MFRPFNSNVPAFNLALSTLFRNPSLLVPNLTIPTILHLPLDLGPHLLPPSSTTPRRSPPEIRALVLDKDNTLTLPNSLTLPRAYLEKLRELRTAQSSPFNQATNPHSVLIVSNTAGSDPSNPIYEAEAQYVEARLFDLRIPVFRVPRPDNYRSSQSEQIDPTTATAQRQQRRRQRRSPSMKKPFSHPAILQYFKDRGVVERPDEIAVVGDRLGTDVLMASMMGAWSVWVRNGVTAPEAGDADVGKDGVVDRRGWLAKGEAALERYLRRRGVRPAMPSGWEDAGN